MDMKIAYMNIPSNACHRNGINQRRHIGRDIGALDRRSWFHAEVMVGIFGSGDKLTPTFLYLSSLEANIHMIGHAGKSSEYLGVIGVTSEELPSLSGLG